MKNTIQSTFCKLGYYSKPDFIIIGTQKGGTSGLFSILRNHTYIEPSLTKEVHYFDNDEWYNEHKIFQYHSFFPLPYRIKKNAKVFEATPLYIFHPEVASRLYSYNPNLKLIIVLRDPAERAFSAWTMRHHNFKTNKNRSLHDPRSFSDAISDEFENFKTETFYDNRISYVKRGIYHQQIENYLKYFKREQLLIIESNDLRKHSDDVLKKVQRYIDVPYEKLAFETSNKSKVNEKEKYAQDINRLREFYKPHNDSLFKLLGKTYDWT
ncbi:sulfotransferase domain-containing protein [Psychroserpens ponticola]|uniref:Sulfotransferase domain-containing protein n=1 Tax=Psychroserpens ponticola TaxID=2932268 RepID=A0ABY7RY65_9FLAO|nr:sulfotransferase domain-containing protein [Psychroserpens ponticola]WCO00645.1 sulfotransferase domain-containing protein [Psychroserpens ponticola]